MEQVETKVDVLAVMDAACCVLAIDKCADPQKRLEQARAAIAELIDKAETAEQALRNLVAAGAHPNWANYADDLRAALARVGGAA